MDKNVKGDVSIDVSQSIAPYTIFKDPRTGADVVLLDPELRLLETTPSAITANTLDSFGAVVAAIATDGGNRLIELNEDGVFTFRDALGPLSRASVTYKLKGAPTTKVLCTGGGFSTSQRDLVRWNEQWPGTLTPDDPQPEAVWEEIASFKVTQSKSVASATSDTKVSVNIEQDDFADGSTFPAFWKAKSAVYEHGAEVEARLRMTLKLPQVDAATQRVTGAPEFSFSLWTPDSRSLLDAALQDAINRLQDVVGEGFTIIRGSIAPGSTSPTSRADDYNGSQRRY